MREVQKRSGKRLAIRTVTLFLGIALTLTALHLLARGQTAVLRSSLQIQRW
jgi:hypothetical protein